MLSFQSTEMEATLVSFSLLVGRWPGEPLTESKALVVAKHPTLLTRGYYRTGAGRPLPLTKALLGAYQILGCSGYP